MTDELTKIFNGSKKQTFKPIDYTSQDSKNKLTEIVLQQKDIQKRREVNWQQLNSFVVKL